MDKKVHNLQLTQIGRKRKREMEVIDFISVRGQQSFEEEAEINPIKIKIENDKIQNMFEKYKKYVTRLRLLSSIKSDAETIFLTTDGLVDAKFSLMNEILYQVIGVINLNKIRNSNDIKKSSRWVNVNFQSQAINSQTTHFSYNFNTTDAGDILNFSLKLEDENKNIEFEESEKKHPVINFLIEFLA